MLTGPTILVVLPLIIPCLIGMVCVCTLPSRTIANGFVRGVIYMGAVLATVYLVFAICCAGWVPIIAAVVFGIGLAIALLVMRGIARNWSRFSLAQLLLFTTIVCIVAATVAYLDWEQHAMEFLAVTVFTGIAASPALNALAYVFTAVAIYRSRQISLSVVAQLALLGSMIVAWIVSWRAAVDVMLVEYRALPPNAGCYVCSAAAYGHGWFVRRDPKPNVHDQYTNLQMRRCKFLEICLACASPMVHQRVRSVYDVIGPRLATVCRSNVWFADATFLLLKPIEWLAELLRRANGASLEKIRELY